MNLVALLAAARAALASPLGSRLIGAALLAATLYSLYAWGYASGGESARSECGRAAAAEEKRIREDLGKRAEAAVVVEQSAQAADTEREVRYRTINREVIRYVEKRAAAVAAAPAAAPVAGLGCGLDADGLRLWSAANRGELPADSAEPGAGLRAATNTGLGLVIRSVDQPRGDSAPTAPVPGPAWRDAALVRGDQQLARVSD